MCYHMCCCVCAVMKVQIELDCEDSRASFYDHTLPSFHNLLEHFITYFSCHCNETAWKKQLREEGVILAHVVHGAESLVTEDLYDCSISHPVRTRRKDGSELVLSLPSSLPF